VILAVSLASIWEFVYFNSILHHRAAKLTNTLSIDDTKRLAVIESVTQSGKAFCTFDRRLIWNISI
jgi:hypothetical protein